MRAIVTGAVGGIGQAAAVALTQASWAKEPQVLLVDLDADRLAATCKAVTAAGGVVRAMAADLSDPESPQAIVDAAQAAFGGLDVLVSNAGILHGAPLAELKVADFDRVFAINTRATWLLGKAALPLLARSRGALVATASISSEHPTPPLGAYAASKAALVMLVRQMALEWGPDGVRCNCVSPGPTLTPMTASGYADAERRSQREAGLPLRRLGAPEDVASAIAFLASPAAANITGQNLMVDGGLSNTLMTASGAGSGQTRAG